MRSTKTKSKTHPVRTIYIHDTYIFLPYLVPHLANSKDVKFQLPMSSLTIFLQGQVIDPKTNPPDLYIIQN